jgi:hypothetical protein
MNDAPPHLPPPGRTRPFAARLNAIRIRFTLRELLLFMLACAAFLGWGQAIYRRQQSFRPTCVAEYFVKSFGSEIAEIAASQGAGGAALSFPAPSNTKQLSGGIEGKEQMRLRWDSDLTMPLEKAWRLRRDLVRRAIDRIKQSHAGDVIGCFENLSDRGQRASDQDLPRQIDSRYLGYDMTGIFGFYEDDIHYRSGDVHGELRISLLAIEGKPVRLMARIHEWRPL